MRPPSGSVARGREEDLGHTYDFWYRGAAEKHVTWIIHESHKVLVLF